VGTRHGATWYRVFVLVATMTVTVLDTLREAAPGTPLPKLGDKVVVHYSGWLASASPGTAPFDSSRDRGHAFTFTVGVGKVIAGWDDAIKDMGKGCRRKVHISSEDGYGSRGRPPTIPGDADLVFDIELLNINETLVEEGMRIRREEQARADHFLKIQDAARAVEAAKQQQQAASSSARRKRASSSSSGSDSDSDSSSESEAGRKRRKRERKERKREKREKKAKRKKHKHKHEKKRKDKTDKKKRRKRKHGSSHSSSSGSDSEGRE
jgi:hypothetical protein